MENLGLVGFTGAGANRLFSALTGQPAPSEYEAAVGIATVPDARLEQLAAMSASKKVVHAGFELSTCVLWSNTTCPGLSADRVSFNSAGSRGMDCAETTTPAPKQAKKPIPTNHVDLVRITASMSRKQELARDIIPVLFADAAGEPVNRDAAVLTHQAELGRERRRQIRGDPVHPRPRRKP